MKINHVKAVYFSPVGHTRGVTEKIAGVLATCFKTPLEIIDFTLPKDRAQPRSFSSEDLVVFGVPTYAGRVPNKILPFVQELFHGDDTKTVAVVTFGNRSFDSSLTELTEELTKNGFRICGAGAFACSHVFSDRIAGIRPDGQDLEKIEDFASAVAAKISKASDKAALSIPKIRDGEAVGDYYVPRGADGQPAGFLKAKPGTDPRLCDNCGICALACPMGSIDPADVCQITGICIKCYACVRKCPRGAKSFTDPALLSHISMLEQNFTERKEPEVYV